MSELNPYQAPVTDEPFVDSEAEWGNENLFPIKKGLLTVYYGVLTSVFSSLVGFPLAVIGLLGSFWMIGRVLVTLVSVTFLGGIVTVFIGQVICMRPPIRSKARRLAVATVVLQMVALVLLLGNLFVSPFVLMRASATLFVIPEIINLIFFACWMASWITFAKFLKRVNEFIDQTDLAKTSQSLVAMETVLLALAGFLVLVDYASFFVPDFPSDAFVFVVLSLSRLVLVILSIAVIAKFTSLVKSTARAISFSANAKGADA